MNKLPVKPAEESTILMVDDDARYLDAFSGLLSSEGYNLLTTTSGPEALRLVQEENPDVVILDVIMPGVSGIELCREIKSWPGYLPIILVTGLEKKQRLEGLRAGADDFLTKPLDALELRARVRSLLRTKQLYDEVEASRDNLEEIVEARTAELRQANKRLKELNEVKGRVLAIVAHELRTPLMQAMTSLDLYKKVNLKEDKRVEVGQVIDESLMRLKNRIDDIDVYNDPGALKPKAVSVPSLIYPALERVRSMQRNNVDRVRVSLRSDLPAVYVDPTALTHTLAHLIDNGLKFGGEEPVNVTAERHDFGALIRISDTGRGIEQQKLPLLFSPLQQGDDSSTRERDGLGLGLALVKMILDAHEIELSITSQPNQGTTISMVLPSA